MKLDETSEDEGDGTTKIIVIVIVIVIILDIYNIILQCGAPKIAKLVYKYNN